MVRGWGGEMAFFFERGRGVRGRGVGDVGDVGAEVLGYQGA